MNVVLCMVFGSRLIANIISGSVVGCVGFFVVGAMDFIVIWGGVF